MSIEGERDALILRLLSQILIKLHAGREWGLDEAGVLALTKEAESMAEASQALICPSCRAPWQPQEDDDSTCGPCGAFVKGPVRPSQSR